MASLTRNNALYEWIPPADGVTNYSVNGLNQLTAVDSQTIIHGGRGNVTGDGASTFAYNVINQLTQVVKAGAPSTKRQAPERPPSSTSVRWPPHRVGYQPGGGACLA